MGTFPVSNRRWIMRSFVPVVALFLACPLKIQAFGGHQFGISSRSSSVGSQSFSLDFYHSKGSPSSWRRRTVHYAIVYDENGDVVTLDDEGNEEDGSDRTSAMNMQLREWLSQKLEKTSLTRLACAYATPPHDNLHPKRVDSAHIVHVDSSHLDIALAMADVQVLVSIPYPNPCTNVDDIPVASTETYFSGDVKFSLTNIKECILRNIEQLDLRANQIIMHREWEQNNDDVALDRQQTVQFLQEEPNGDELPDWWTYPELNYLLANECTSMKALLNEADFEDDIMRLVSLSLSHRNKKRDHEPGTMKVLEAGVACVGPSGLLLRARIEMTESGEPAATEQASSATTIMECPIQFDRMATSGDELQALVLDIVEPTAPPEEDSISSSNSQDSEEVISGELESVTADVIQDRMSSDQGEYEEQSISIPAADESESRSSDDDGSANPNKEQVVKVEESTLPSSSSTLSVLMDERFVRARRQPKSASEEAELAAKYAAIESISERAFQILLDLGMVQDTSVE